MNYQELFIHKKEEFEKVWSLITAAIDVKQELPNQIFKPAFSGFALGEFDWAMSGDFWGTLQQLTKVTGDSTAYIAVLDPEPTEYYFHHFGYYNIASLPITMSKDDYWQLLGTAPQNNPADSLLFNSFIVVWFPPSLRWFIFGQRTYEVCILAFADEETKKAAQAITDTWMPMDDMISIMSSNFSKEIMPKEFEVAFRENYKNPLYEDVIGKQLIKEVFKGNFEGASKLLRNFCALPAMVSNMLFAAAHDDANFISYAFLLFLISKAQTISNYTEACVMLQKALSYLPGAYKAAAHHARIVFFDLSRHDPIYGSQFLSLYGLPEEPITAEEALCVAKKILHVEPENQIAKEIIQKAAARLEEPITPPRNERDQLERLIRAGLLIQAKTFSVMSSFSTQELHEIILYLGCEERNLCAYTFTWVLMQEREQAELHYIAYRIVTQAWTSTNLAGCYTTGAYHLRRAMHLDPTNVKYAEHFLLLHTPPQQPSDVISNAEAEAVARRILALKHGTFSAAAKRVLRKLGKIE